MIVGTALAIVYMFNTFVTATQFNELALDLAYRSYYELLDRRNIALDKGNVDLAREFSRRMEQLKAKICEEDPEWERFDATVK